MTSPCCVQANFYSCGAYGTPVSNTLGGPTVLGCVKGNYSDAIQGIFENCATNELDHVAFIQNTLGIALFFKQASMWISLTPTLYCRIAFLTVFAFLTG